MSVIRDYLSLRKVKQKEARDIITNMANHYDNHHTTTTITPNNVNNNSIVNNPTNSPEHIEKKSGAGGGTTTKDSFLNSFTNFNWNYPSLKKSIGGMKHHKFYMNLNHETRPRLVKKCGELNIDVESVPKRKRRLLSDFFNTILDIKWRWHIFIFIMTFLISWIVFATAWYFIAYVHGDFNNTFSESSSSTIAPISLEQHKHMQEPQNASAVRTALNETLAMIDHLLKTQPETITTTSKLNEFYAALNVSQFQLHNLSHQIEHLNFLHQQQQQPSLTPHPQTTPQPKQPCVHGIHDFTSALLYSVETQHTIGYGLRHITEECPHAILFLMLQSCFGIFVQGLVAGVVFAKISRPNKRKRTIIFSHNAVVSERDGQLLLMFKIGNVRISQLSDAKLKMLMVKSRQTSDGEFIPFQTYNMKVGYDWSGNDNVFFPWPKTVEHVIDSSSPFYEICKEVIENPKKTSPINPTCIDTETETDQESLLPHTQSTLYTTTDPAAYTPDDARSAQSLKNIDYEIVVMLEGNIETTGASCHIRTSYLPQEILFGYRFVPIYPKFTKFEYKFDFSKFDQVEPVQSHLFHLNLDHHFNKTVYDAKKEEKNFQLTYQNTIVNGGFSTDMDCQQFNVKNPVSIKNLLSAFKAHEQKTKCEEANVAVEKDNQVKPPCPTILEMGSDRMDSGCPKSKYNGRFTVVPVCEILAEKTILIRKTNKPILKRAGSNTHNQIRLHNSRARHSRANSVPPVLTFCQSVLVNPKSAKRTESASTSCSAEDEGLDLASYRQISSSVNVKDYINALNV